MRSVLIIPFKNININIVYPFLLDSLLVIIESFVYVTSIKYEVYFPQSICRTSAFLSLPFCHLVALLREDGIEMPYEEHIFEAMKRWIVHDAESRSRHLLALMKCVRLNFVSRWYLIEVKKSFLSEIISD